MTVAAIDIGTNTLLLLILDDQGAIVHDECRFGRLGRGLDSTGQLSQESIDASLDAIRDFRRHLDRHGVSKLAVVGTQALREASNAGLFVAPAEDILGVSIETIAGEREAALVHSAVRTDFPDITGPLVIVDVGGGSTEIISCDDSGVLWLSSTKLGSVRMSERHLAATDPPLAQETAALMSDIDEVLHETVGARLPQNAHMIATAGTATTLAAIDVHLSAYDRDAIHGHVMAASVVDRHLANLLGQPSGARRKVVGLEPERADVICGGIAILSRIVAHVGASSLTVADSGVRWGLAYEQL